MDCLKKIINGLIPLQQQKTKDLSIVKKKDWN